MRLSSLFMVVFFLGMIGLGIMHEQVHVAIYQKYGIESHVEYLEYFPGIATIAESDCPNDTCKFAHNLNEIISYPLMILYIVFGAFCEIVIILKEETLMIKNGN